MKYAKIIGMALAVLGLTVLTGCSFKASQPTVTEEVVQTTQAEEPAEEEVAEAIQEEEPEEVNIDIPEEEDVIEEEPIMVDLMIFAGQSNMSGCGGDASLAPFVSEKAGYEFRAISDPTKLYPITEPFGINENYLNGILDLPGGKKGSLVSAFVNEYYLETKVPTIAVSAAMGETSIYDWTSENMSGDILYRFTSARDYLRNNGYAIRHMYLIWLQGESDGLEHTDPDMYKSKMGDFIAPLWNEGIEKVFFITPGRTYESNQIFNKIINAQLNMCKESDYYALATSILCAVSTEYMSDIYHYNQHVLNLTGKEAAKAVAYYTNNQKEKIVFDYKNGAPLIPKGYENEEYDLNEIFIDLSNTDINQY